MLKHFLAYFIFFLISSIAYCGTIDPSTPDSKHVEYGSKFVYIAKVHGTTTDTNPYFGSGVAYRSNIVVTAAHVVKGVSTCKVSINNKTINVSQIIAHPKYKAERFGYYDIAICLLEDEIGLGWYPELYTGRDEIGKICAIAGYGTAGDFVVGANKTDNNLRAGSNIIDGLDKGLLICSPSKNNKTELEYCIASGDSGGGLFINNKIAGINSCVIHDKGQVRSTYGTLSGHTRVSDHIKWINQTLSIIKEVK